MNRRNAVKGALAFGFLGTSVFSITKWFKLHEPIQVSEFLKFKPLIAELADTVIPRTNTPGAKDANVEDYIIKMLINCTEIKVQHKFLNGLKDVQEYSRNLFNKSFENCQMAERITVLKHFENKTSFDSTLIGKVQKRVLGQSFFAKLKELTIRGYFTSLSGATKCLAYDYIPGKFQSCTPLLPNQKSWATK